MEKTEAELVERKKELEKRKTELELMSKGIEKEKTEIQERLKERLHLQEKEAAEKDVVVEAALSKVGNGTRSRNYQMFRISKAFYLTGWRGG